MNRIWIALAVVAVIILIYCVLTWNTTSYEDYLHGMWLAEDDDFCEDTEIESMMLFIGQADSGVRNCHLVIMNDMCNQGFTMKHKPGWAGPGLPKYTINAEINMDDVQIWPETVTIDVDILRGVMKIHSDGTLYAKLHKQHEISNLCRDLASAELVGGE